VTPALTSLLARCDAAVVEANHCPEMLADGPYPALDVVGSAARRIEVEVLPHGAVCALSVRSTKPYQLSLSLGLT
jgi:hypothetical protein